MVGIMDRSSIIGYYDKVTTYDYDLINAYPTCMCLVPDVDWCNSVVIQRELYNRPIILQDFRTPFDRSFVHSSANEFISSLFKP